jgi:two-component system nitrogen regulation sensor histidine kinase NtrY
VKRSARERLRDLLVGKTERRLALVILVTTMVPLAAALYLGTQMFRRASAVWFNPEIGEQLDRGVDIYKDYVRALKDDLKHQTFAMAADPALMAALREGSTPALATPLDAMLRAYPDVISLRIEDAEGRPLAERSRDRVLDAAHERAHTVRKDIAQTTSGQALEATFVVSRKRLDELERSSEVVKRYHQIEASRSDVYQGYLNVYALLLGVTLLLTVPLGILLARGVTRRINRLSAAINLVAAGDLSVRVPVTGSDELTELARTFNRMIGEISQSRSRIEFLQRISASQDMAQRLAHEIKNPLTPIQLAVQECHRKYAGEDVQFRALLDTTLEIVEEEVGTLRRLVGDFSNFARLPQASLERAELGSFLRDCEGQLGHLEDPTLGDSPDAEPITTKNVEIEWEAPPSNLEVAIDRQMLRRVLINLVRNAVQAIRDHRGRTSRPSSPTLEGNVLGHVLVSAAPDGDGVRLDVEDDGPGISPAVLGRVFDPYVTTKADGTGLGLAIVKKIVVEHGGEIEADRSPRLGGARFTVRLPGIKVLGILAEAREARERARLQGVETGDGA